MFGVGWAELFVILLVAILVIPPRHWPDVARFLAQCVKVIRNIIWKVSDAGEQIKEQVARELPLDEIVKKTTDDVISAFSEPINSPSLAKGCPRRGRGSGKSDKTTTPSCGLRRNPPLPRAPRKSKIFVGGSQRRGIK